MNAVERMAPPRSPGARIRGPSRALISAFLLAFLSPGFSAGEERRVHLVVDRSTDAGACPDAASLASTIARVSGHDAPDVTAADAGAATRLEVSFTRQGAGYSATLVIDGAQSRARTIAARGPACGALGEAVAATIGLVLDGLDAEPRADAPGLAPSAPPAVAPVPAPPAQGGRWTAPPWVERPLTLPAGRLAIDLGVGGTTFVVNTGVVANAEMAFGITDRVEIGVRSGLRFVDDGTGMAGGYARLFDRETFAEGPNGVSNPELRLRGATIRDAVGELALEVRVVFPLASDSRPGFAFGVPLAFHLGDRVRIDTGAYQLVSDRVTLSVPVDVWIQVTPRFWVGPRLGAVFNTAASSNSPSDLSVGFGAGYQILPFIDLKAGILDPAVFNQGSAYGAGFAVQTRIE